MTRCLIGLDDTDNATSRGTGYRARRLGEMLRSAGLAEVESITRHQLLLSPRIRYTSHNSSACLSVRALRGDITEVFEASREYLLAQAAEGSNAGMCLARWDEVAPEARAFGRAAKVEVLSREAAEGVARAAGVRLEIVTGSGEGMIGALAAVGLRADGNDGRFVWLPGLRELHGVYSARELQQAAGIDRVTRSDGGEIPPAGRVHLGDWVRPILRGGKAVLLVEEVQDGEGYQWRVVPREVIKHRSD